MDNIGTNIRLNEELSILRNKACLFEYKNKLNVISHKLNK